MNRYECQTCGHIYSEEEGDPMHGITPGTKWEDLPDDWTCPDCGTNKSDYRLYED